MTNHNTRILLAKPPFDCHDIGAKVLSVVLRDAGFEVVYTGQAKTLDSIANAAIQEDVALIGLSILTDPPVPIVQEIRRILKENDCDDIPIVIGGIVSPNDRNTLMQELNVAEVFGPGTKFDTIIGRIQSLT
jgi:methylmalonyl-CoA mutase C-terminal domain/subunit